MSKAPELDALLTLDEASQWLGIERRDLSKKSRGRKAVIPAARISRKVIRFHPRTILAKFATEGGVSPEVIAAAFNGIINSPASTSPTSTNS